MQQEDEPFYRLHIEHIVAKQHHGSDDADNLALACHHCNVHKGTNLTAIDPMTRDLVRLFNPRTQAWDDHFELHGSVIVGRTSAGRATLTLLEMNAPSRALLRPKQDA
jgi:hypothetical protein